MTDLLKAFGRALRDIWSPRMLALAVWPLFAALVLWLVLAWFYWAEWAHLVDGWITGSILVDWLPAGGVLELARLAAWILLSLLLIPLVMATAGMLAAALAMPLIVGFVAARGYPALERRRGGSFAGSFIYGLIAVGVFAALWIVTLPLWLTGVLGPPLALLLTAWLIQRLFRYDALAEHADAAEYRAIVKACRGRFFLLGLLVALLYTIPFANLFAPVAGGLVFTHFSLARLAGIRREERGVRREEKSSS